MRIKAYKFRLYPNKKQKELINQTFGCNRYIYNKALETKIKYYEKTKKTISCFDLIKTLLKEEKTQHDWLKIPYSQTLQMSIRNLDNAFTNFFRTKKGFPKFKSRKNRQSVQYPQNVKIDWGSNKVYFPKLKQINAKLSRKFEGKIKTSTLSKTSTDKYFVSVLVETNDRIPSKFKITEDNSIGVDLGIKSYITTSNGDKVNYPKFLRISQLKLQHYQRRASKQNKGSLRRKKYMKSVTKLHEKIANQRSDWLHKLSTKLIRENQTICLEDLNVSSMQKNHYLAQSISDCSWSLFVNMLEYKSEWYGVNILKIGRFDPSSKTCSNCGHINRNLKLNQRTWMCSECKTKLDRDINAAQNIKNFALVDKNLMYKNSGLGEPGELQNDNITTLVG